MPELVVPRIESPWARAWRSFLSAIASDPLLATIVALLSAGNFAELEKNKVPIAMAVIASLIVALISLLGGFSELWQSKTQTPVSKSVVQFLQKLIVGAGVVLVAVQDNDTTFDFTKKIPGLIAAAVISGVITYCLNRAQDGKVGAHEALQPSVTLGKNKAA